MSRIRGKQGIDCVSLHIEFQKLHIAICGSELLDLSGTSQHRCKRISSAKQCSYQVCYDVVVTLHMFSHTDGLQKKEKDREKHYYLLLCM